MRKQRTEGRTRQVLAVGLLAITVSVAGCGSSDSKTTDASAKTTTTTAKTGTGTNDQASPAPSGSGDVDVCALFTKADFEAATGETAAADGEATAPKGSILGGCKYATASGAPTVAITARPASEWDGTVEMYDNLQAADRAGVVGYFGEDIGMLIKLEGQSYFLQILAITDAGSMKFDSALSDKVSAAIAT